MTLQCQVCGGPNADYVHGNKPVERQIMLPTCAHATFEMAVLTVWHVPGTGGKETACLCRPCFDGMVKEAFGL